MVFLFILKWADRSNSFETAALIIILNVTIVCALLMCEPGARMTADFARFEEELGKCEWYLMPIGMQRVYIIFLSDTQNSIEMTSYGRLVCNRETLKKVHHSISD